MSDYLSYKFEDSESFVDTYDELPLWSSPFGMLLLQHFRYLPGQTVVDVGCGTGFPLIEIAARLGDTSKCYGVDIWANAGARVTKKIRNYGLKNVELIQGPAEKMPFADESVDVVISNLGINNFDNPAVVFSECNRILKPGGRLMLTTNVTGHWKEFYSVFYSVLDMLDKQDTRQKLLEQEMHRGNIDSISRLFTDSKFKIGRSEVSGFEMHFTDGSSFLNHYFVKLGWLSSWMEIIPVEECASVLGQLEKALNDEAATKGQLTLSVPILFIEGVKSV